MDHQQQQQQVGTLSFDEYGNPIIVLNKEEEKQRIRGIDAHKANIVAAKAVCDMIKSSLGPSGMDKIITGADGEVTVSNDGATILSKIDVDHVIGKLLVSLSQSQDDQIGDGTTGVVLLAGSLLEQCYKLIEKGIHPLRITDGFEKACEIAIDAISKKCAVQIKNEDLEKVLFDSAKTALGSKVVSGTANDLFARMAVDAVKSVASKERQGDVNFDLIKIVTKTGGNLTNSCILNGVVIDKDFSHPQMPKDIENAKIAILTCPFEPPKPKTKHSIEVTSAAAYEELYKTEQKYFTQMIKDLKSNNVDVAICQWGFDDEANHLLSEHNIPAIRWVGGVEIELIAIATGARIVPRFSELSDSKLGFAKRIRELSLGTGQRDSIIFIESGDETNQSDNNNSCVQTKTVTALIRGGNKMIVEEAERSLHDAMCVVRNLLREPIIVPGGGACEVEAAVEISKAALAEPTIEQYAMSAFADALDVIPIVLAENSGFNALKVVSELHASHRQGHTRSGVNCLSSSADAVVELDILNNSKIYESLASKTQQLRLATQVVKMIMKIDDIITPKDY